MRVLDTHTHVASIASGRDADASLSGDWWSAGASAEDLFDALDANSVAGAVIVQAIGAHGYDCSYATAVARTHHDRCSLVIAADMHTDRPGEDLESLIDSFDDEVPLRGVRLFGVDGRDPVWLTDGRAAEVCELAADLELTIVPTIFADRFTALGSLLQDFPSVAFALDHCGFLDLGDDDAEQRLLDLASFDNLHLKVTSHVLEAAERDEGDAAPLVERLAEGFGARRLCWGSDHPQDRRRDYAGKLTLAQQATRTWTEDDCLHLFNITADRLFF